MYPSYLLQEYVQILVKSFAEGGCHPQGDNQYGYHNDHNVIEHHLLDSAHIKLIQQHNNIPSQFIDMKVIGQIILSLDLIGGDTLGQTEILNLFKTFTLVIAAYDNTVVIGYDT